MGTITVSVDDEIENRFRKTVKKTLGTGKGKLGLAFNKAMEKWTKEQEQEKAGKELLELMKKGYNMGGITYKQRSELYERD